MEAEAGRLLAEQWAKVTASAAVAAQHGSAEALHATRIGIRRMRTVLRAFRRPLCKTSASKIDRDLGALNRALGPARDLDAWIGLLSEEAIATELSEHRLAPKFLAHQRELRRVHQATVRRQLRGSRFASLKVRIGRLLEQELPAATVDSPWVAYQGQARKALRKELRRVLRHGKFRRSASLEELHRLRIGLRRIRYLAYFFGEALGGSISKLAKRAHAVEKLLGEMRDSHLALERIRREGPPPPRVLVRRLQGSAKVQPAAIEEAWARLSDRKFVASVRRDLAT